MPKQKILNWFEALDEALPDNLILDLIELQIAEKAWFFALGDRTNEIWKWCQDNKAHYTTSEQKRMPYTFEMVCEFVSRKLDNARHGAASIYKYANLALVYSSNRVRRRYERLPISHFDYAAQFDTDTARKILEHDLQQCDARGGRPQSLKALQRYFEPEKYAIQADEVMRAPIPDLDQPGAEEITSDFMQLHEMPFDYSELRSVTSTWQVFNQQLLRLVQNNPGAARRIQPMLQRIRDDFQQLIDEIKATSTIRE